MSLGLHGYESMRDSFFTIEDRFIMTAQELEYSEVEEQDERTVDEAIDLLYQKVKTRDFDFSDDEREILEDAFIAVNDQ